MLPKVGRIHVITKDGIIREAQKVYIEYGMSDDKMEGFTDAFNLPEVSIKTYAYRIINDDKELELIAKDDVVVIDKEILFNLFLGLK